MAGRWVVTLMVNTNKNRVSQPLALTWPTSTEGLRDVLSFFCFFNVCLPPSLHPRPTNAHVKAARADWCMCVMSVHEVRRGRVVLQGWATDGVVGSRMEAGRGGGVKGSDWEGRSKGKGRERCNVLRELWGEVSSHCPLPPVPPLSFTPSCWLVVRKSGWKCHERVLSPLFRFLFLPLPKTLFLFSSPNNPCSAHL